MAAMLGWLMNVEQLMEWELVEETEVLGENLPHCQMYPPQIPHYLTRDRAQAVGTVSISLRRNLI
jgi:hypothetical protein